MRAGNPVPEAFKSKPEVPPELEEYLDAFWLLNTSRAMGFGIGYIPMTEIESFCRMFPIDDVSRFVEIIRSMDKVFVDFRQEQVRR